MFIAWQQLIKLLHILPNTASKKSANCILLRRLRLFLVAVTIFVSGRAYAASPALFRDIPRTSPYFNAVQYLSETQVIQGYPDETFQPDRSINRAESLKIILKGAGTRLADKLGLISFSDIKPEDWFAPFVVTAHQKGIVSGNADGSFAPGRQVNKAEFLKMLMLANQVNLESAAAPTLSFKDVPTEAWFAPYLYYAFNLGIIAPEAPGVLNPHKLLTRGEVAEILYRLILVKKGTDTQFLLDRTEDQLTQIEVYVAANRVDLAEKASKLAVDLSQQALKNLPGSPVVLGVAKLARAYDFLVQAYDLGVQKKREESAMQANQAILKATEAWQANKATEPIARHIKERAREILAQVGGAEGQ